MFCVPQVYAGTRKKNNLVSNEKVHICLHVYILLQVEQRTSHVIFTHLKATFRETSDYFKRKMNDWQESHVHIHRAHVVHWR